jgi:hypothetical protein
MCSGSSEELSEVGARAALRYGEVRWAPKNVRYRGWHCEHLLLALLLVGQAADNIDDCPLHNRTTPCSE